MIFPPANQRSAGFSLVEVIVAIVILSVALVGLTQGITTALSSNKESEWQTQAALIAAGQIETLRAEGNLVDGETDGSGGEGLAMYHWKQSVSSTDIDGLHEIAVVVDNTNSSKAIYELRTYIFDPGDTVQDDARDKRNPSGATKKEKHRK
jgi:prepilin-type N-terminal cleavage/methylation domain-containing protein